MRSRVQVPLSLLHNQAVTAIRCNCFFAWRRTEKDFSLEAYEDLIEYEQWDAEIIGPCTNLYNCHGYAWHKSDGGSTV